jgi:2,3-bisphosphoglycerate-dependent phosphoglycerate mutase
MSSAKDDRNANVIYLVRHGETTWNRVGRQQGHDDSPLTETGIEQALAAGRMLQRTIPDIHSICIETSPLGRARQTALIISEILGFDPNAILVTPLLIEHHLGCWQGLTHAEIDARYPGAWQAREQNKWDYVVPGGESYVLVAERAKQWLAKKRHAPITIAVTHAIISRTIQGAYGGFTPLETVARSHRQDRVYRLHAGAVEELSCEG